jgi:hypothetical protein
MSSLAARIARAALLACAPLAVSAGATSSPAASLCAATAARGSSDARLQQAVDEARRQHQLFGGQTIGRNGSLVRPGYHEGEWSRPAGDPVPAWERVAAFWRSLGDAEAPSLMTSAGAIGLGEALRTAAATGHAGSLAELALRESLQRAAMMDTPWSAVFISHLMKHAGFTRDEFAFSDSHSTYVSAALEASAAEAAGQSASHAFRACDVATTRPRVGDLLCATREGTAGTERFSALRQAIATRLPGQSFPMHCDLVVRADQGGDGKLETIGGNVVNSVTLTQLTLNAAKVLGGAYLASHAPRLACGPGSSPCREHLGRRPWLVLLQFRH